MKKKQLGSCVFVVIIIFISSFSSVVSSSTRNESFVDYSVTCIGLDYHKTFSLSQETNTAIESLIKELRITLSQTSTREQVTELFKNVIFDLDKYGLFDDMNIKQIQQLVTGNLFPYPIVDSTEHSIHEKNNEQDSNLFCLIAGHTKNSYFEPHIGRLAKKPTCLLLELEHYARLNDLNNLERIFDSLLMPLFGLLFFAMFPAQFNPFPLCCDIGLGARSEGSNESRINPANGWITTIGLKGIKQWNETFFGNLLRLPIILPLFDGGIVYPGISGFTGFKLSAIGSFECFYLGTALQVKIGSEIPYEYYPFHWE